MTETSYRVLLLACVGLALAGTGCRLHKDRSGADIRTVLNQQVRDWNAGNLAGFMEGYERSETTRFASGGDVTLGWQKVFDRYQKKYGTGTEMGTLTFTNIEVTVPSPGAGYAFGHWHLKRGTEESSGLFTLVFRKTPAGWRIVHDHTSVATKP